MLFSRLRKKEQFCGYFFGNFQIGDYGDSWSKLELITKEIKKNLQLKRWRSIRKMPEKFIIPPERLFTVRLTAAPLGKPKNCRLLAPGKFY
jgi:hypothetical protein